MQETISKHDPFAALRIKEFLLFLNTRFFLTLAIQMCLPPLRIPMTQKRVVQPAPQLPRLRSDPLSVIILQECLATTGFICKRMVPLVRVQEPVREIVL